VSVFDPTPGRVRPVLIGTGLSLLCGCGGGGEPLAGSRTTGGTAAPQSVALSKTESLPAAVPGVDVNALRYALDDRQADTREDAVERLGELGTEDAVRALEQALRDPDPDVRSAAIGELADIPGDASAHALSIVLFSEDVNEREDAVDALADLGGLVAYSLLERALSDEDPYVRRLAAEHLAELQR
jgi:HEAT repeat protein